MPGRSWSIDPENLSAGDAHRHGHAQFLAGKDDETNGPAHCPLPPKLFPPWLLSKGRYFLELHPVARVRARESFCRIWRVGGAARKAPSQRLRAVTSLVAMNKAVRESRSLLPERSPDHDSARASDVQLRSWRNCGRDSRDGP